MQTKKSEAGGCLLGCGLFIIVFAVGIGLLYLSSVMCKAHDYSALDFFGLLIGLVGLGLLILSFFAAAIGMDG